jgi:hypothetical protein
MSNFISLIPDSRVIHRKVGPAQGIFLSICKILGMNKLKRIIEGPAELTKVS